MKEKQSQSEIKELLEMYDGVTVESMRPSNGELSITLTIASAASIVRIERATEGANGRGSIYAIGSPVDGESCAESLARLRFNYSFTSGAENPNLEWFGLFLVWDLEKRKILDRIEAERLLLLWNGAARW